MSGRPGQPARRHGWTFRRSLTQPWVVRGLTADELWVWWGSSARVGMVLGIPLAWLCVTLAMVATLIVAAIRHGSVSWAAARADAQGGSPDNLAVRHSVVGSRCAIPSLAPYTERQVAWSAGSGTDGALECAMSASDEIRTCSALQGPCAGAGALFVVALCWLRLVECASRSGHSRARTAFGRVASRWEGA